MFSEFLVQQDMTGDVICRMGLAVWMPLPSSPTLWHPQSLLPLYSLLTFQFQCRIYPFLFPHIILVTIGKPQTTQMHTMQILTVQNQPSLIYKYCST